MTHPQCVPTCVYIVLNNMSLYDACACVCCALQCSAVLLLLLSHTAPRRPPAAVIARHFVHLFSFFFFFFISLDCVSCYGFLSWSFLLRYRFRNAYLVCRGSINPACALLFVRHLSPSPLHFRFSQNPSRCGAV